ncbi:nucleosome assembly protein 1-like 1-A [Neocloeon triangulifer]|uniref:nucleosome assembly protein 1-like 1-A n=1 Tax=Neocloeon triangulifer TaxID=2078957 RepID=UPI00286F1969|nr:nucleosome assembly protein 1-like 1-A [Neocloeon triangulifer]
MAADKSKDDVELDEMEDEEEAGEGVAITKRGLPGSLTAYQNFLEMMQALSPSVKRRLKALKRLQFESTKVEAQFYQEYHELEMKYQSLYQPFRDKRKEIVSGTHEPTDQEAEWPSDDEKEDELCSDAKSKMKIEDVAAEGKTATEDKNKKNESEKGVPDFWLTIFKNVGILAEMIQEHDEPILKHLKDIVVTLTDKPMGFKLDFYFTPNEFFNNSVLTKYYEMKCEPDEADAFSFEGPEIVKCSGCTIDWKKGKNVTVKVVKKKQKHRSRGSVRTVTRTVQNDSFFNFFEPPTVEDAENEMDEHIQSLLTADFEIGHYIRERIVPNAVLFFTGEALEDEEYEEEEEMEDEDEEEGENEGGGVINKSSIRNAAAGANPNECKQQ